VPHLGHLTCDDTRQVRRFPSSWSRPAIRGQVRPSRVKSSNGCAHPRSLKSARAVVRLHLGPCDMRCEFVPRRSRDELSGHLRSTRLARVIRIAGIARGTARISHRGGEAGPTSSRCAAVHARAGPSSRKKLPTRQNVQPRALGQGVQVRGPNSARPERRSKNIPQRQRSNLGTALAP
jgi:hypothetical protein